MRSFVAIPLGPETRERLSALQEGPGGIRWQDPGKMHLTLQFLGNLSDERLDRMEERLQRISFPAFDIRLSGVGAFPGRESPKVLWAGVEPEPRLMELRRDVESAATAVGLEPDEREYIPHVTLGRRKNGNDGEIRAYLDRHEDWKAKKIPVSRFLLYTSRLTRDGAIHKVRARFESGG